ncbi:HNH endonuclease family protein [Occultella gossypii]|uniref:HNH endonuclease n=1 Tax=Occultella gossypii TaxID=2800820 RepID=A0ABS7S4F8_9MICO|nr:HNH endonuclease family protein [Occultella gossypii]MBZ2194997.1 HNH endonuclease [Occultella gossypii]
MPVPASTGALPPPPPPRRPVRHDPHGAIVHPSRRPGRLRVIVAAAVLLVIAAALFLLWRPAPEGTTTPAGPPPSATTPAAPPTEATAAPTGAVVPATPTAPAPLPGTALAAVEQLVVAANDPFDGYDRDAFGYRSVDLDRNGCDVRNDVLRRDLVDVTIRPGTNGCVVETGTLQDPYTGTVMAFQRGSDTSGQVQIDHVVALANAWVTGAQDWDATESEQFGNDPLNLLAVNGPANQGKGADDAAEWLPPNAGFRCEYVAIQVAVKLAYELTVTAAEQDAMLDVLATCPAQPLPTAAGTATP